MFNPNSYLFRQEGTAAVLEQAENGTMVHAVLISGASGTGKWTLATSLAAVLLCQGEGRKPCGICRACRQMRDLEHPDLIVLQKGVPISPDEKTPKATIPIGDIREMIRLTSIHPMEGDRHVILIRHAEDMNSSAQNALLKTLEEPPEGTFFLLTAVHPDELLSTIISRCRPLKLSLWPEEEVAKALLASGIAEEKALRAAGASGGSVGEAVRIAADEKYWQFRGEVIRDFLDCPSRSEILSISTRWKDRKADAEGIFALIERMMNGLMHKTLGVSSLQTTESDIPPKWLEFAKHADMETYLKIQDGILKARMRTQNNVNFQAAVEQLILILMEAVSR